MDNNSIDKNIDLTPKEQEILNDFIKKQYKGEMNQVQELIKFCNNKYQFAKTHSVYLKDWEKTKAEMEKRLQSGHLPLGIRPILMRAMIDGAEEIIQKKLKMVRGAFEREFCESIYNYLGPDGKTKKIFGIFG